ncbi:hypothetical protein [Xanthomonas translucens]|uniref:hypothetical protein n=1 Tax=Xanthomonas campestris pv. translucens TaxID=343 RepID=UPI001F508A85|nr:hypothetical protein [Xanthomonas translucens]WLA00929.1 hypothetical protein MO330_19525 [Xanthomonas translucens]
MAAAISPRRAGLAARRWNLSGGWRAMRRTAVLEANFLPRSAYERDKLAGLDAVIVEVHCHCGADETARRFRDHAAAGAHHAAHPLKELPQDMLAQYAGPVGLGTVVAMDARVPVDLERLVAKVWQTSVISGEEPGTTGSKLNSSPGLVFIHNPP